MLTGFVLFFYLYSIQFVHSPVGTRAALGFLGLALFIANTSRTQLAIRIRPREIGAAALLALICAASSVAVIANGTTDLTFFKYPISIVLIVFAAYFIVAVLRNGETVVTAHQLIDAFIAAIVAQDFIAIMMFAFPSVTEIANSIQYVSHLDQGLLGQVDGMRIIGFGSKFFDAGIVNGFALILICYRITRFECSRLRAHVLSILFFFVLIAGIMMARTTMLGAALALLLLFTGYKDASIRANRRLMLVYLVLVPLVLFAVYDMFLADSDIKNLVEFGFELFFNMSENGKLESKSTDQLLDMYAYVGQLPLSIGDGMFVDRLDPERYYRTVDVGYLRLILYFGLPGMLLFCAFQLYSIQIACKRARLTVAFFLTLSAYLLVLSAKGLTDLFFLVAPFFFCDAAGSERDAATTGAP